MADANEKKRQAKELKQLKRAKDDANIPKKQGKKSSKPAVAVTIPEPETFDVAEEADSSVPEDEVNSEEENGEEEINSDEEEISISTRGARSAKKQKVSAAIDPNPKLTPGKKAQFFAAQQANAMRDQVLASMAQTPVGYVAMQEDPGQSSSSSSAPSNVFIRNNLAKAGKGLMKCSDLKYSTIMEFKTYLEQVKLAGNHIDRNANILSEPKDMITLNFIAKDLVPENDREAWLAWDDETFFKHLLTVYCESTKARATQSLPITQKLKELNFKMSVKNNEVISEFLNEMFKVLREATDYSKSEEETTLVTIMNEVLSPVERAVPVKTYQHLQTLMRSRKDIKNLDQWTIGLLRECNMINTAYDKMTKCGLASIKTNFANLEESEDTPATTICEGCGMKNHLREACRFNGVHPEYNRDGKFWDSGSGKRCKAKHLRCLPYNTLISGQPFDKFEEEKAARAANRDRYSQSGRGDASGRGNQGRGGRGRGRDGGRSGTTGRGRCEYISALSSSSNSPTISTFIKLKCMSDRLTVNTLLDTGAIQGNYISLDAMERLQAQPSGSTCHCAIDTSNARTICSGINDLCSSSLGSITLEWFFLNELTKAYDKHVLTFSIIDTMYDIIIGKPSILERSLVLQLPSYFLSLRDATLLLQMIPNLAHLIAVGSAPSNSIRYPFTTVENLCAMRQRKVYLCPKVTMQLAIIEERKHIRELLDYEPDSDEIDDRYVEPPWERKVENNNRAVDLVGIHGPPQLQAKLRELISEFDDVFCETVKPEPARIPPMEIEIDPTKWQRNCNRGPPRPVSLAKEEEIKKQTDNMLNLNVIEFSTSTEYSQVLLTPKPGGKWRFCIDFRRANDASGSRAWPIPIIMQMLQRIGSQKPKWFAKIDMTSGYHQAPLHENSRFISAFICFIGIFQWLRVPMGLKGAGAYFQQMVATVVLVGLIYTICELYIDDIIVPAKTEDELIERLRKVLLRFREFNITANPKKCDFGMSEVEYVGHVMNEHGLSFSKGKVAEVLDFPVPTIMKGLKSFLGLANYFRDHIRNHSSVVKPLHNLVSNYEKNKLLKWTPEATAAFEEIKTRIANCPTLYFMDAHAPVTVQTDASDYGIGAYCFQTIDGVEKPTAIMSKSLTPEQCRWSVPEKEAYAIWYTLTKWEHLLKDIHFTLQTDHKNLTYLNMEGSPKVKRWKLDVQEYDCDIVHIAGVDNPIADSFSRLCTAQTLARVCAIQDTEYVSALAETKVPSAQYKIIGKVHNSTSGHHGVERTYNKLQAQGHTWPYMRAHVQRFIKMCPLCQKMSQIKPVIHTHPFTTASYDPMEVLNIDTIGPMTEDNDGNKFIIVIICCFTRFVELYPAKDTSAEHAAAALLKHIGRYGAPTHIRSDRGSQYVNETITHLLQAIGTEQMLTTAYSKEENAIVERANKEVMRHLRAIVFHKKSMAHWSTQDLPMVMRILNAEVKKSINVSPAQLLFGNSVNLDRGIFLPQAPTKGGTRRLSTQVDHMLSRQADLIRIAKTTQSELDEYHMISRDDKNPITVYPVNSYVLQRYHQKPPGKFPNDWYGPKLVTNNVGPTYTVQDLITGKLSDTHVSNLKPFLYDPEHVDPLSVAMQDNQEFLIDHIIEHRGQRNNKTAMEFKVRWSGQDPSQDTWESWKELRNTVQLREYLAQHKMKALITK